MPILDLVLIGFYRSQGQYNGTAHLDVIQK